MANSVKVIGLDVIRKPSLLPVVARQEDRTRPFGLQLIFQKADATCDVRVPDMRAFFFG
jgi:hypothetical protein